MIKKHPVKHNLFEKKYYHSCFGHALDCLVLDSIDKNKPYLIITSSPSEAKKLAASIAFFQPKMKCLYFQDHETLPYDQFSPQPSTHSKRLEVLYKLQNFKQGCIITSLPTLMKKLPPKTFIRKNTFQYDASDPISYSDTLNLCVNSQYQRSTQVEAHGEYAVRGSIIDVFPSGSKHPLRLDFFDETLENIRTFDIKSQRSLTNIDQISFMPAHEFPLDPETIQRFRNNWQEHFKQQFRHHPIYNAISSSIPIAGSEYFLPLFFDHALPLLFEYLPKNTRFILPANLASLCQKQIKYLNDRHHLLRNTESQPLLPVEQLYANWEVINQYLNQSNHIIHTASRPKEIEENTINLKSQQLNLDISSEKETSIKKINTWLRKHRLCIVSSSKGEQNILTELLEEYGLPYFCCNNWDQVKQSDQPLCLCIGSIFHPTNFTTLNIGVISQSKFLNTKHEKNNYFKPRISKSNPWDAHIEDLSRIKLDELIVHRKHGIGRYQGLSTLKHDEKQQDYILLNYFNNDKLYVPIEDIFLLSRYIGPDNKDMSLSMLGNKKWGKDKEKVLKKIQDTAAELLKIFAARENEPGYSYAIKKQTFEKFLETFPFKDTSDQIASTSDIIQDLTAKKRMDRLLCGDVGFGKTELAMRAAFIVSQNAKQVAVLVPTTLLAQQHLLSFKKRFFDWPINIEVLSSMQSTSEHEQTLNGLKSGSLDIVIGTHSLLQNSVSFHDLGLLIVDEEHRFGVRHKEKIKSMTLNIDILSMTATPIPRSLHMALNNLRDISILNTAPINRLPVNTIVEPYSAQLVQEAITRELNRGGQVFILYNEVDSMPEFADTIKTLLPKKAMLATAHGQMPKSQLESVMLNFYQNKFDVLIASTIIESGLDLPNANTIIIHRADKFGLSQLHQLRGRVGRSNQQAYAYLLTPEYGKILKDSRARLNALVAHTELGSGFNLAIEDLELRGAGELLGEAQSGHIQSIGLSLYNTLLKEAVLQLKNECPKSDSAVHCNLNLQITALIPEKYVPDIPQRIYFYQKLANIKDIHALQIIQIELIDRFGQHPQEVTQLILCMKIKYYAQIIGIKEIKENIQSFHLIFNENPKIKQQQILDLLRKPLEFKLISSNQLRFITNPKRNKYTDLLNLLKGFINNYAKESCNE
jgi:transcription-repair coupling factor (superfamily II helicase)